MTSYQYNPDGALTAVTTRTGIARATTTYLTWDNFVPDEANPSTGTVYAGNGNLVAIGPEPNTGTSLFGFDRRDRLTSFRASDRSAAYGYHATGRLAASTAAGGSGFGFYYAGGTMANLRQTDTDLWSARLGPARYLDDGTEEVLLTPRKDVVATYDPADETLTSYRYDAFGKEDNAPLSTAYDLTDNPHRYAGGYRDPLWGGYYLEARWYDPDLATFLSRDPVGGFHPYAYGDGNPVMMVDPTGMSAQTAGHVTGESSPGSVLFNVFVAPLFSILTDEFWSNVAHNRDQAAVFLGVGVLAEVAFFGLDTFAVSAAWRGLRTGVRWATQSTVDVGLNLGQAAVSATHGGKFDINAFGQNLEGLPMGLFYARSLAGIGRRTHVLRPTDISKRILTLNDDTVLVFRARTVRRIDVYTGWTSPVLEALNIGHYHDQILAVGNKYTAYNDIITKVAESPSGEYRKYPLQRSKEYPTQDFIDDAPLLQGEGLAAYEEPKYQYVGKIRSKQFNFTNFMNINPLGHFVDEVNPAVTSRPYNSLSNNCHRHAQSVVKELRKEPWMMQ